MVSGTTIVLVSISLQSETGSVVKNSKLKLARQPDLENAKYAFLKCNVMHFAHTIYAKIWEQLPIVMSHW